MRYVRFKQILFQNIIEYKWYVMIIFQYSLLDWVDIVMIITYESNFDACALIWMHH